MAWGKSTIGAHRAYCEKHIEKLKHRFVGSTPALELRFYSLAWEWSRANLSPLIVKSAAKLVRRKLDAFMDPEIVAVGALSISPVPEGGTWHWSACFRLAVMGVTDSTIQLHLLDKPIGTVRIADDVHVALREAVNPDLVPIKGLRISSRQKSEYLAWLAELKPGERILRYGIDRHGNELTKKLRVPLPKVSKPRPYPHWLERYQFGNREI